MLVWQGTDYIFTAGQPASQGGYMITLTISISIIRNSLMVKKKMTKTILTILIIIQIIVEPISINFWDCGCYLSSLQFLIA